jgi:negative regulator of sigma E activity
MTSEHDKVLDHTRLQLSALFDGELGMDEARFLKRRLEHDAALGECWSRWQLAGDALRGQATAAAPAGFAARVAGAVAAEEAAAPGARQAHRRSFWVPGAALAASVAALAMFMTRQAPEVSAPGAPQVQVASAAPGTAPLPQAPVAPSPGLPQAPDTAAQVAAAVAVAAVPRRAAAERRARGQQQRAASTRVARTQSAERLVASAGTPAPAMAVAADGTGVNPFAPDAAADVIAAKPWPRALLPGASGAFNVGYGHLQPGAAPVHLHPFAPRAPGVEQALTPTHEDND